MFMGSIHLEIYVGIPGSGKTTIAAHIAKKAIKLGIPVYSNVPIKGTYNLNPKIDLGRYLIEDCVVLIDEAGLEHSNRNFKSFSEFNKQFYKLHRHYKAKVFVFSQADDMDLIIRNIAFKFWLVKQSLIPYLTVAKPTRRYIGIDDMTHELKSMMEFKSFLFTKRYINPLVWKMFNTYEAPRLEDKVWIKW